MAWSLPASASNSGLVFSPNALASGSYNDGGDTVSACDEHIYDGGGSIVTLRVRQPDGRWIAKAPVTAYYGNCNTEVRDVGLENAWLDIEVCKTATGLCTRRSFSGS
jgi:hypothetical protein